MIAHERIAAGVCSCGATYSWAWATWDEWWLEHARGVAETPKEAPAG